jgi:hypothetical protein
MFPAVNCGSACSLGRHAALPDLPTNEVGGADILSSQRGNAVSAAYVCVAWRVVQELHAPGVWGVHLTEPAAGVVGDNFVFHHAGLFFYEYL